MFSVCVDIQKDYIDSLSKRFWIPCLNYFTIHVNRKAMGNVPLLISFFILITFLFAERRMVSSFDLPQLIRKSIVKEIWGQMILIKKAKVICSILKSSADWTSKKRNVPVIVWLRRGDTLTYWTFV